MPFPVPGRIADALRRATVQVLTRSAAASGNGSGVVLPGGRILTNAHVVNGSAELIVEDFEGTATRARVIRSSPEQDVALLETGRTADAALAFRSEAVASGEPVIAVGNPLGFVGALSTGYVQRVAEVRGLGRAEWIHSDVRLAPGNSGGPLADIHGQLVGLNTMIAGPVSFALPVRLIQGFLSTRARRAPLGVTGHPLRVGTSGGIGLRLLTVEKDGAADRASLMPGDVLISARGRRLQSIDDLHAAIAAGAVMPVEFLRGPSGPVRRVAVELFASPTVNAA